MVTLKDVAEVCGCTVSTVSRALRGDGRIAAATVQRIKVAALRLGYRPNLAARTLVTGRTRTVLFLTGELSALTNHRPAEAASRRCLHLGLDLLVATHHGDAASHQRLLDRLGQGLADGALIAAETVDSGSAGLRRLVTSGYPVVFVDRHVPGLRAAVVTSDNAAAVHLLVEQLAAAGARWIGDGFGRQNPAEQMRSAGCAAACRRFGLRRISLTGKNALPADGPVAVVGTGNALVRRTAARTDRCGRHLLAGVFDAWYGDPPSDSDVWVCDQDFTAMATIACDRLALRIQGQADPEQNQPTRVPPLGVRAVTGGA